MNVLKKTVFILALCLTLTSYAWNALGHKLVMQIAYSQLTPHAKRIFNHYNRALNKDYKTNSLVSAAVWLDTLYYRKINWFNTLHYENLFFTEDDSMLPMAVGHGALWGIDEATEVLSRSQSTDLEKGLALRILLHVVADIHQPLHAASRISHRYPTGDRGGNLVRLGKNIVAANLHAYWDRGGGWLLLKEKLSHKKRIQWANEVKQKYPCHQEEKITDFYKWSQESHKLAVAVAYKLQEGELPSKSYQQLVQHTSEQRIALAGCRLGYLLNYIDERLTTRL
ncbi:MAG: S1/P1 nuclease [Legionella sp.]